MNAEAIKEIASQLGLATIKVQDMVCSLVPQYVSYQILRYLGRSLLLGAILVPLAGLCLYEVKAEYMDEDTPEAQKTYKMIRATTWACVAVVIIGYLVLNIAQVVNAPELSFLLFVTK